MSTAFSELDSLCAANPLRIGVLGLGRAFMLMRPTFASDTRVQLVAAFDPAQDAMAQFSREYPSALHCKSIDELCADSSVELVYIASPHCFHAEQAIQALRAGKHVLVEKPMALTLADCDAMIAAAKQNERHLIVGHSHSFDLPILHAGRVIKSGRFGAVKMIHSMNYTDFLYRPRRPEELVTDQGGGVIFSQAAHQIDIVRWLTDSPVCSVRAHTGNWDATRNTEGAYSALLSFKSGAFASLTYSGYGLYDSDEQMGWIDELGRRKPSTGFSSARQIMATVPALEEKKLKAARGYGALLTQDLKKPVIERAGHEHFGPLIVSCERADLRTRPHEVMIFHAKGVEVERLEVALVPRKEVVDEIIASVRLNIEPPHSGAFARRTLAVCVAMLASARNNSEIFLDE